MNMSLSAVGPAVGPAVGRIANAAVAQTDAPRVLYAIRNIRACGVNLLMNDFAAGLPSPLAFLGLADLLVRKLNLAPWSARVIPILHQVCVSDGRTKPEMENKSGVFRPVETIENMTGVVDLSLLIEAPGCDSAADLARVMAGCRIAGGSIQNDTIDISQVTADGSAFRSLRRGYAMVRPDRPDRLMISAGDPDGIRAIARLIFPASRPQGFGWIAPVAVGYRLLEDPETVPKRGRTRSRDIPHVFAEPLVGVAELVSVRNARLTGLYEADLASLMWSWDARGSLVLGHADYHPAPSTSSTALS